MSLEYIRRTYHVPAKRGGIIVYGASDGESIKARITGSRGHQLRARMMRNDGTFDKRAALFHPTWHITYLSARPAGSAPSEGRTPCSPNPANPHALA
jgi:hypothetical protein